MILHVRTVSLRKVPQEELQNTIREQFPYDLQKYITFPTITHNITKKV